MKLNAKKFVLNTSLILSVTLAESKLASLVSSHSPPLLLWERPTCSSKPNQGKMRMERLRLLLATSKPDQDIREAVKFPCSVFLLKFSWMVRHIPEAALWKCVIANLLLRPLNMIVHSSPPDTSNRISIKLHTNTCRMKTTLRRTSKTKMVKLLQSLATSPLCL